MPRKATRLLIGNWFLFFIWFLTVAALKSELEIQLVTIFSLSISNLMPSTYKQKLAISFDHPVTSLTLDPLGNFACLAA